MCEGLTRAALDERIEEILCDIDDLEHSPLPHHCWVASIQEERCYCENLKQELDDLRAHLQTLDEMNMHDGYDLD